MNQKHVDALVAKISLCWLNIIAVLELGSSRMPARGIAGGSFQAAGAAWPPRVLAKSVRG